jgi:hypothetical protein
MTSLGDTFVCRLGCNGALRRIDNLSKRGDHDVSSGMAECHRMNRIGMWMPAASNNA